MTNSIRYEFASRIRSLTCRSRFASPPFATREELRLTWRCWTARDRYTLPNLRWRAHEATNFAAWSNCIGHWGEGGSGVWVGQGKMVAGKFSDWDFGSIFLNQQPV